MTSPSPWVPGEWINAGKMYDRITAPLRGLPQGFIGEALGQSPTTLASTSSEYVGSGAAVTFTLTEQRRVRIVTVAQFVNSSGANPGRYQAQPAYSSGNTASTSSVTRAGLTLPVTLSGTGLLRGGVSNEASALLPAGTYTAFGIVKRVVGGNNNDTCDTCFVQVQDLGAA